MNAVIYARYSSHGQTEQSIEGQLRDNYAWAKQQGISVVGEYVDRARSGTKDTRPDFQRMIEDAAKKQFEMVIVWKLDRFARNRYDSAIYKAKLKKYGVRVVSVNGKPLTYTSFAHILSNTAYIGQYKYNGVVVPGLAQQLIDTDIFQRVQDRLKLVHRSPAAKKAKVDYLLQGKAYCGYCGAPMVGESGRSRNGDKYYYYACAVKKKRHGCHKRNERKDFIEWYVVEQTVQYILTPDYAARVAKAVVEEYNREFSDSTISYLEKALKQIDREMDKLVDAIVEAPKVAHPKIYERMEALEAQKADIETDLAKLRIAQEIKLTETEVKAWLKTFCAGDPLDEDFRRRIIDVFINTIYLYDDRVIVFYNIRGGKQVSYFDLINSSDLPDKESGSDLKANAPPPNNADFDTKSALLLFAHKAL